MHQDTEKVKTPVIPIQDPEAYVNLVKIQAQRQLKTGVRTSLKGLAADIIKNAKA
jgi:hypothetical protein